MIEIDSPRNSNGVYIYGFVLAGFYKDRTIGLLQVKYHFKEKASPSLIGYSLTVMTKALETFTGKVSLNFPGIGAGGLPRESVLPMIEELDNRFTVHEK